MNGNKILIDTNIIIYILLGNKEYIDKIQNKKIYVSIISKLEVLGYNFENTKDEKKALEFFDGVSEINIDNNLEKLIILLKRKFKIKLPDSIILSSSILYGLNFITNDLDLLKIYNRVLIDKEIIGQVKNTGL